MGERRRSAGAVSALALGALALGSISAAEPGPVATPAEIEEEHESRLGASRFGNNPVVARAYLEHLERQLRAAQPQQRALLVPAFAEAVLYLTQAEGATQGPAAVQRAADMLMEGLEANLGDPAVNVSLLRQLLELKEPPVVDRERLVRIAAGLDAAGGPDGAGLRDALGPDPTGEPRGQEAPEAPEGGAERPPMKDARPRQPPSPVPAP